MPVEMLTLLWWAYEQIYLVINVWMESLLIYIYRAYSGPLLGATIAPNIVPWVLKKIFSLKMVENDICLRGTSKCPFFRKYALENASMLPMSRISPDIGIYCLEFIFHYIK